MERQYQEMIDGFEKAQKRGMHVSIFNGTSDIVSAFLNLESKQHLKQLSVSRSLRDADGRDFLRFVTTLYSRIEANYSGRQPSEENWRSQRVTTLSDHNKSPEVILERAVAMLGDAGMMPDWLNQIPTASGLVDDRSDKRAAIDLIKLSGDVAQFIELKWESDTPAYAIFEVLNYGLVYLFCRVNAKTFGYTSRPLMQVRHIDLEVVAPSLFYAKHDLSWLELKLSSAIRTFSFQKTAGELSMGFKIFTLPQDFELPFNNGAKARVACETDPPTEAARRVCKAFENLSPVWSPGGGIPT